APAAPVFLAGAILRGLCGGDGVDGRHEAFFEAEGVLDDLGDGGEAVGGAGGVGDDRVPGGVVPGVVDAHAEGGNRFGGLRRRGDDDALGAGREVLAGAFGVGEEAGGLEDVLNTQVFPGE